MSDQLHAVLSLAIEPLVPNEEEPGWANSLYLANTIQGLKK